MPKEGKGNEYARGQADPVAPLRRPDGAARAFGERVEPEVHEFAGIGRGERCAYESRRRGRRRRGRCGYSRGWPRPWPVPLSRARPVAGAEAVVSAPKPVEPAAEAPTRKSWYSSEHEEVIPVAAEPEITIVKGPVMPQEYRTAPAPTADVADAELTPGEPRRAEFDWGVDEDLTTGVQTRQSTSPGGMGGQSNPCRSAIPRPCGRGGAGLWSRLAPVVAPNRHSRCAADRGR